MTSNKDQQAFQQFLDFFPEISLPVTLTEDTHHTFSRENKPLPQALIDRFILVGAETDEFTEFVPCFQLPETHGFHAIVYWEARLLNYAFILATFDKKGESIARRAIAGTHAEPGRLTNTICTIEEDWIMYVVEGEKAESKEFYDASKSKAMNLELLATGEIITL